MGTDLYFNNNDWCVLQSSGLVIIFANIVYIHIYIYMGVSQNYGYLFGGPCNKDYSIWGPILGSPYFGKLPYMHLYTHILGLDFLLLHEPGPIYSSVSLCMHFGGARHMINVSRSPGY